MAPRKTVRKLPSPKSKKRKVSRGARKRTRQPSSPRFVGRDGSPVLEKYTPKAMDAAVGAVAPARSLPPKTLSNTATPLPTIPAAPAPRLEPAPASSPPPGGAPRVLISLEKPFDVDDFSQLLGQTQIQVTVPRDSLAEVLRRACDFMGFGIYVYSIRVRPGPEELLKTFIVELQRVDYSAQAHDWSPFQERGRADNPFGPTGNR